MRVLEFAGLGPVPHAAMLLSDMGADIIHIGRPDRKRRKTDVTLRGRRFLDLDLKAEPNRDAVLRLARHADVLMEGFRPGVMERLGLGPDRLLSENPRLVYGRMTGWGQTGPLASLAGHDIDYIAAAGALGMIGEPGGPPVIPLNLIGDYAGGSLYLVIGILGAIVEARRSGRGQVIDCAICDGVISLLSLFHGLSAASQWQDSRGTNRLDGGAHYYATYECADGKFLAVGAGEPQFYASFRTVAGLTDAEFDRQHDRALWPRLKEKAQAIFKTRTREEWLSAFAGTDACVAPVLSLRETFDYPHFVERANFIAVDGVTQSAPAPRFSRTPSSIAASRALDSVEEALSEWGAPTEAGIR